MSEEAVSGLTVDSVWDLDVEELRRRCVKACVPCEGFSDKWEFAKALLPKDVVETAFSTKTFDDNLIRVGAHPKLIFLDVDGVLNTNPLGKPGRNTFEMGLVDRLVKLVLSTGAHVVWSTAWRHRPYSKLRLMGTLVEAGLHRSCIVGQTPSIDFRYRAEEICKWFDERPNCSPKSWVALDDMDLVTGWQFRSAAKRLRHNFVWMDPKFGITEEKATRARAILERDLEPVTSYQDGTSPGGSPARPNAKARTCAMM